MTSRRRVLMTLEAAILVMAAGGPAWAAEAHAKEKEKEPDPFHYDAGSHRDPFSPLVRDGRVISAASSASFEPAKPVLYGVLWDPKGSSIALINETEVKVGDLVGDVRVLEIRQNSVVLGNGGEQPMVLQMGVETLQRDNALQAPPTGASTGGEGQ